MNRPLFDVGDDQDGNLAGIGAAGVVRGDVVLDLLVPEVLEPYRHLHDVAGAGAADTVQLEGLEADLSDPDPFPKGLLSFGENAPVICGIFIVSALKSRAMRKLLTARGTPAASGIEYR